MKKENNQNINKIMGFPVLFSFVDLHFDVSVFTIVYQGHCSYHNNFNHSY